MNKVAYIITNNSVALVANGKSYTISSTDAFYPQILEALKSKDYDLAISLLDKPQTVSNQSNGKITVLNGGIYYQGNPIHNAVSERILQFIRDGLPFEPLMKFLENLMQNPSFRAVQETYTFLEQKNLPITDDGHFLAYKAVTHDFKDKYTKKVDNSIGKVVWMDRCDVDDNPNNSCSNGYHAGSIEYVKNFGGNGDRLLIVKINPKDVVSVPKEDCRKMRVCRYEVIEEYKQDLAEPCYEVEETEDNISWIDYGKTLGVKVPPKKTVKVYKGWKKQKRDKAGRFKKGSFVKKMFKKLKKKANKYTTKKSNKSKKT